jgi:ABC-type bacteriocin/lantibiotic exporter with double-glycine peptidase domain
LRLKLDLGGYMKIGTKDFKRCWQMDEYSCGARSVYMILRHYGFKISYREVKEGVECDPDGTEVKPIRRFLKEFGLPMRYQPTMYMKDLKKALADGGVVIVAVDGDHYAVVHGMDLKKKVMAIADPAPARCFWRTQPAKAFRKRWNYWGLVVFPPRAKAARAA